jgi:hypothetical protein
VVNVVTRSGTNGFHGSLYEFLRNNVFDARNYFAPPNVPAPFRENQFGAAVGGPIIKNKTFFFVNYDGQRVRDSLSQLFSVPTAAQRAGNPGDLSPVHDPMSKAPIANNNLNNDPNYNASNPSTKAALALLNLLPLPTSSGNTNNLRCIGQEKIDANQDDARLDHLISAADTTFVRASVLDANELDPFGSSVLNEALLPGFGRILKTHTVALALGETHIFSSNVVNEFRFGWLRVSGGQKDPNAGNPFAATYGLNGTTTNPADMGYPQINLSGLFSTIGTATGFNTRIDRDFEFFDNVSYQHGRHTFTFGGYFFISPSIRRSQTTPAEPIPSTVPTAETRWLISYSDIHHKDRWASERERKMLKRTGHIFTSRTAGSSHLDSRWIWVSVTNTTRTSPRRPTRPPTST